MVQTRRQYNQWVENRGSNYQSSQSESECSQCSQDSYSYNHDADNAPNYPSYRSNDQCKRHRQQDDDPYTENVVSYTRRKPRN